MGFWPWPHHNSGEWKIHHDTRSISALYGVSVTHRPQGLNSFITHKGEVRIEGTDKEEINVIIDFKATSKVLAESIDVSVLNGNDIIITVLHLEIISFNVRPMKRIQEAITVSNSTLLFRFLIPLHWSNFHLSIQKSLYQTI